MSGQKTRSLSCVKEGNKVEESQCQFDALPTQLETCNPSSCPVWRFQVWSECSVSCGIGIRTREVYCALEDRVVARGIEEIPIESPEYESLRLSTSCDEDIRPAKTIECQAERECPEWRMSSWSACSTTCGEGFRMRSVYCSGEGCVLDKKPKNKEPCSLPPCLADWLVGNWSEVSLTIIDSSLNETNKLKVFALATLLVLWKVWLIN